MRALLSWPCNSNELCCSGPKLPTFASQSASACCFQPSGWLQGAPAQLGLHFGASHSLGQPHRPSVSSASGPRRCWALSICLPLAESPSCRAQHKGFQCMTPCAEAMSVANPSAPPHECCQPLCPLPMIVATPSAPPMSVANPSAPPWVLPTPLPHPTQALEGRNKKCWPPPSLIWRVGGSVLNIRWQWSQQINASFVDATSLDCRGSSHVLIVQPTQIAFMLGRLQLTNLNSNSKLAFSLAAASAFEPPSLLCDSFITTPSIAFAASLLLGPEAKPVASAIGLASAIPAHDESAAAWSGSGVGFCTSCMHTMMTRWELIFESSSTCLSKLWADCSVAVCAVPSCMSIQVKACLMTAEIASCAVTQKSGPSYSSCSAQCLFLRIVWQG